ncbi:MAG: FtsX-like permease family protein [Gammaproteobacteria bacterium]|nr:FtsX-like permease family protein [Gammaproteobacteria bacterium]MYG67016.1 FtsX-like permease family protein [Gammaproteobacteria bacterium]
MMVSVSEGLRSLLRTKLRSALALTGIVIGVGSVITMISIGEIARETTRARFEALGTDIVTIGNVDGASIAPGRSIVFADALALANSVPSILETAPRIELYDGFVHAGKELARGPVHGVTEAFARINRLETAEGRFISHFDRHRQFCVLGADIANAMRRAGATHVVGGTIALMGRLFTVTGVLHEAAENHAVPFQLKADSSVFIPISTARRIRPETGIDVIVARTGPGIHYSQVTSNVQAWFRSRWKDLELTVTSPTQLVEQQEGQMRIMTLLLAATGSISLIVGGIGVMNVMLVSVTERRREIGIRRALGARRRDIQKQFLVEAAILSAAGGILGVLLGTAGTWTICRFTEWDFFVSMDATVSGIVVSSTIGIVFGFQPANLAARVDPIIALQG